MKEELRAITKNQRSLDSAVMMILADAVGKILLLRITAHVGERKYRDGGPVGQRQGRTRRLVTLIRRRAGGICLFGAG